MSWSYILIPLLTLAVSLGGSSFTSGGIGSGWYDKLVKPSWTPPGWVIGIVWTTIFILAAISAILVWNGMPRSNVFWFIIMLFLLNGLLNVFWSYLFFGAPHALGWATLEAAVLDLSVIALVVLIWPFSRLAAGLLMPYAAWVAFATYLTSVVWHLNN
ncbi:MAG TPA: TspO/MBR family protein [Candidatus Paceibacterota bacterium]|nr:TspO/MBR family protein [Candidatus Paceibacterota bacterium]